MRITRSCLLIAVLGSAAIEFGISNGFARGPAYRVADIALNHPIKI